MYLLESNNFKDVKMLFNYDLNGRLIEYKLEGELSDMQLSWLFNHFPFAEVVLRRHGKLPEFKLTEIQPDLSFNAFWDKYAHKVGNKKRVEKLWNGLSEPEKAAVFPAIKRYNFYLANRPGMQRTYPETFLSQRRWENEYK